MFEPSNSLYIQLKYVGNSSFTTFFCYRQESTHPIHQFAVCGGITHNSHDLTDLNNTDDNTVKVVIFSVNKSEVDSVEFNAFSSVFSFYSSSKNRMLNSYRDQMKKVAFLFFT